ncbi:MAG TPA: YeeE/YedE thiosulfate transporter family protein [Rhodocyclaceae bacterium]|nr:YeeE/YedE thiosulfate transporter family protein [Rhodocyclaceae bacterium]
MTEHLLHFFPNGLARYLIGGLLIGAGVALLFITTGRQGGASTFLSAIWSSVLKTPFFQQPLLRDSRRWRTVYAIGMLLGGALFALFGLPVEATHVPAWKFAIGGVLIGFGARLGGGCTSGHGICGMASLSGGSILMVCTFLGTAIATAMLLARFGV